MDARVFHRLKNSILNLLARAVVTLVDDTTQLQVVQVAALEGEVRDACERFQQFGFTGRPLPGAEAVLVFPAGDRANGIVLAIDDRRYRKRNLAAGEAAVYNSGGSYILLKVSGAIEANAPLNLVSGAVLKVAGNQVVGARQSAITRPTGGGTIDTQARTAINAILDALSPSGHGLTS